MNEIAQSPEPPKDSNTKNGSTVPQKKRAPASETHGKFLPVLWTFASIVSLLVNIILIVLVIVLASQLFKIKELVQVELIDGFYDNFVKMDQARISTTIQVVDTITVQAEIPVVFDLPLKQGTEIILTKDTAIRKAIVYLNGQPVPTDITLRQGTRMSIALDMVVPVNQTIPVVLNVPVNLQVPVDIPLANTELHEPFAGLQDVVAPYKKLLDSWPSSWRELFLLK